MTKILPAKRGLFAFGPGRSRAGASDPVLRVLLAALAVVLVAILAAGTLAGEARADQMRLRDVQSGQLLLRTDQPGAYRPAPLVKTDVHMDVSGTIARVTVSQYFENPSDDWVEGVYAFPLPETAAVDRLRLQIGERFIEGRIKEREAARQIYEQAKAKGHKASLVEEQRPNLFTNEVANIGPRESVLVQIEYQQTVRYDQGAFSLRFPLVIGPRYIPGGGQLVAQAGGPAVVPDPVPDADRITPPVLHPSLGKVNPVTLAIELDAGTTLAWIKSPTHDIAVTPGANGRQTVTFASEGNFADRDFVLDWQPATGTAPATGLFRETVGDDSFVLVTVMPPVASAETVKRLPRDVTFVIDTSGSMSGPSIRQARQALHLALDRLAPADRFNIVRFSDTASRLFAAPEPATKAAVDRAHGFVDTLEAEGGTEMMAALRLALAEPAAENRLGQIVFLTDGSVGNEAQLFAFIKDRVGATRLFTVGIGSAPNSYFMTKAAELGRGTFTYIGRVEEVAEKMAALYQKIEEPVVTDIALAVKGAGAVETWPRTLPDLYRGEPVVASIRVPGAGTDTPRGTVEITGLHAGKRWSVAVPLANARPAKGVGALWARSKIGALSDGLHEGVDRETVKRAVVEVALAHHLVSAYTSLVAVDVTPSRPDGSDLSTRDVPLNLPAGWNFDKVFGERPLPAVAPTHLRKADASLDAAARTQLAEARAAAGSSATLSTLPQGATPASLKLLAGALSLLLALALLWWHRRQTLAPR